MKKANHSNTEFINTVIAHKKSGNPYMILFIDNLRLYQRKGVKYTAVEQMLPNVRKLKDEKVERLKSEDLLFLCSTMPDVNFVIFTGFEDTPIDEEIHNKIPPNILRIFACNCMYYDHPKLTPIFYGIQRKLNVNDRRHEIIKVKIHDHVKPTKLLYLNHREANNQMRKGLHDMFSNNSWATVDTPKGIDQTSYTNYLNQIQSHKFMISPAGNAPCETHRDIEILYMKRVPVCLRSDYLEKIFYGIPVLFVESFSEVTEDLLIANNHLFEQMQTIDLNRFDIRNYYQHLLSQV
jgi:hypothetical protein